MSSLVIMPCSWNKTLINLYLVHIHVCLQLMDERIHLKHTHQSPGSRCTFSMGHLLSRSSINFLKLHNKTHKMKYVRCSAANTQNCLCICPVRLVSSQGAFIGQAKNEFRPLTHPGNSQLVRLRCTIENQFDLTRWTR